VKKVFLVLFLGFVELHLLEPCLCRLRITTQLRSGIVDKMAGIFTKPIWQP